MTSRAFPGDPAVIIDSSAIAAIVFDEPERAPFLAALRHSGGGVMSAASYVELCAVVDERRDPALSGRLDQLLSELGVTIVELTAEQAIIARRACRDFGRGSGHPARLNLGDCFTYALAADRDEPLLFTGDDFIHTDLVPAVS